MRRWPSLVPTKRLSSKARMYSMVRGSLRSWWTRYAVCMTQAAVRRTDRWLLQRRYYFCTARGPVQIRAGRQGLEGDGVERIQTRDGSDKVIAAQQCRLQTQTRHDTPTSFLTLRNSEWIYLLLQLYRRDDRRTFQSRKLGTSKYQKNATSINLTSVSLSQSHYIVL